METYIAIQGVILSIFKRELRSSDDVVLEIQYFDQAACVIF